MKNFFCNSLKKYMPIQLLSLWILFGFTLITAHPTLAQQTLCQQIGGNFVPQITVGQNQFSTTFTSNLATAIWQNKKVLINGTLVVNSNFQIASCSLKMGTNATIRVDPNITFNSTYSKYFHCGIDYWKGFVFTGGTSGIWFNHIEDAQIALDIKTSTANVVVAGNLINRNRKGMYAANIAVNAIVAANTFDCSTNLNGEFSPYGIAGIDLNSCPSSSIGLTLPQAGLRNIFRKQIDGIKLYNTTSTIGLSTFERNKRGLIADESNVTVRGADATLTTNFLVNREDVYTTHSSLNVFNCNMDSCLLNNITALMNNNLEQIHIYDNAINMTNEPTPENTKIGISLDRSRFGNDNLFRNTIERNHLVINDFFSNPRRGMHIRGSIGTHDFMRIDSNNIEVLNGGTSSYPTKFVDVNISTAENFKITRNSISSTNNFQTGSSRWGFFLSNGANFPAEGNEISNNSVLGIGPDDGCCAMHAENAGPWGICGNTTDHTYRGFHFMGNCGESNFSNNIIIDHNVDPYNDFLAGTGMLIQGINGDNGFLGDQTCQKNHWDIPFYPLANAYAAAILGNGVSGASSSTISKNEFYVDDINDSHQAPTDRFPFDNTWFRSIGCLQAAVDCSAPILNKFDENDEWVRNNYSTPQPAPDVEEWQSTRYVMAKLFRYPNLAVGNVLTFRNAYNQSSAGLFARFDSMMNAISNVTAASQFQLNTLDADIQAKQAEIGDLDGTISDFMLVDARLLATRATLLAEAAVLSERRSVLRAQNEAAREPLLTECAKFNISLPGNQVYEQNQKLINALTIQLMRGIDLSQADKDTLHSIAQQCYNVAGRTKSAAASLLPPEESTQYYHENPEDYNCPQREAAHQHQHTSAHLLLAPNPASNVLQIQFEKPFVGDLMISDRAGKRIQTFRLNESAKNVDISVATLSNGLYFLSGVDVEGNAIANTKFVVIH